MANIEGISTRKNEQGEITHVTIDIQKHKEIIPMLEQMGVIEKSTFQKEFDESFSLEEARNILFERIENKWKR
jgi:hypothetical protein